MKPSGRATGELSILVGHADLPCVGITTKDHYCVALPCRQFVFRNSAYIVANWEQLDNFAFEVGWRC